MTLRYFHIDAFAEKPFEGNPAGVCLLDEWPDDETLQHIAAETNLSDTAFFVPGQERILIRWFTPQTEVELCGHATLASGWLILNKLEPSRGRVDFDTRSAGPLSVARAENGRLAMRLPAYELEPAEPPKGFIEALGAPPAELLKTANFIAVFESAGEVAALRPDFARLGACLAPLNAGLVATAPGDRGSGLDVVSRMFAPAHGVNEDPVTGSAHAMIGPYWAGRLGKDRLTARQISARGGSMEVAIEKDAVTLIASCVPVIEGAISV